jgi:hypothetical protein
VRKSDKTADYVAQCNARHAARYPGVPQNEDDQLLAVSIAMSGDDAGDAGLAFEEMEWVRGVDFVLTISDDGLRERSPTWLEEFEFTPPLRSELPHPRRPVGPHKAYRIRPEIGQGN